MRRRHLIPFALLVGVLTLTALIKGTPSPCTTTLTELATINTTLKTAAPGADVCLAAGNYELLTLTGINPASQITLQKAPGALVNVHGILMSNGSGGDHHLTIEGFNFTNAVEYPEPPAGPGNITIKGNTFGVNTTGNTVSGSTKITGLPETETARMAVGEAVYAPNISTNSSNQAKITEIKGSEITIEFPATSTATGEKIGVGPIAGVFTKAAAGEHFVENVTIEHNEFSNLGPCPNENKPCGSYAATGQCYTATNGKHKHIIFSHNICGPNVVSHYVQFSAGEYFTDTYNTYLGPSPFNSNTTVHQNVLQIFGSASHIEFSNNVMWGAGGSPAVLIESSSSDPESHFETIGIENNLSVNNVGSQAYNLCPIKGLTFLHNTTFGSENGTLFHPKEGSPGGSYFCLEGSNYNIQHNIFAGTHSGSDVAVGGCETECTIDYNASGDKSVETETHGVPNWTPNWTTTIWSNPSEAFPDPPAGYYLPTGIGIEAGYQGGGGV